jgi:hypothetical protein
MQQSGSPRSDVIWFAVKVWKKTLKITLQLIIPPAAHFSQSVQNHHKIAAEAAACCSHQPVRHWGLKLKLNKQPLITCHLSKVEKHKKHINTLAYSCIDGKWRKVTLPQL